MPRKTPRSVDEDYLCQRCAKNPITTDNELCSDCWFEMQEQAAEDLIDEDRDQLIHWFSD